MDTEHHLRKLMAMQEEAAEKTSKLSLALNHIAEQQGKQNDDIYHIHNELETKVSLQRHESDLYIKVNEEDFTITKLRVDGQVRSYREVGDSVVLGFSWDHFGEPFCSHFRDFF